MRGLVASNVLVSGMQGLGAEIGKNYYSFPYCIFVFFLLLFSLYVDIMLTEDAMLNVC